MALSWLMACKGCVAPNNRSSYHMHSSSLYKSNANSSLTSLSSADSVEAGLGNVPTGISGAGGGGGGGGGGLLSSQVRNSLTQQRQGIPTYVGSTTADRPHSGPPDTITGATTDVQRQEIASPLFRNRADDFVQVDLRQSHSPMQFDDDYVLL